MNRTAATLGALAVAAATVTVTVVAVSPDNEGLTVTAGGPHREGTVPDEPDGDDARALDDYAAELGLVMTRARGPEPAAFARLVDGTGPRVQVLRMSGAVDDGGAELVLRLRLDRTRTEGLFGHSQHSYDVIGCYRWLFDDRIDQHEPQRLATCPDGPVIEVGPAPVDPQLPDGLVDRLSAYLDDRPGPRRAVDVLADVRAQYDAAVESELARGDVDPDQLMDASVALTDGSVAVHDTTVGVAVGQGFACVLVRVSPDDVAVWVPDRVSLQPGEVGCSAAAAAGAK